MIDVHFVFLGAVLAAAGQTNYVVDTVRGRNQPNRVSWLLWAVAPLLAFAVETQEGVGLRSLMTFMAGFGPLVIFCASFANRASVWRLGRFDYACGVLSLGGTVWWLVTRQGVVAISAAIAADAIAAVPTLVKSWNTPESESPGAYAGAFANAGIVLLTITHVSVGVLAFPLYIAVITLVELTLVGGRLGPRLRRLGVLGGDVSGGAVT